MSLIHSYYLFTIYYNFCLESAKNAIGATAASQSGDTLTRATGMTFSEAKQILNVDFETTLTPETLSQIHKDIETRYSHLYTTNEPSNGGSFYIQVYYNIDKFLLVE